MFDKEKARENVLKRFPEFSKESITTILDSETIRARKDRKNLYFKKWRKNNQDRIKIYGKVHVAIRNGSLKKEKCFCGNEDSEAHHEDYTKPLDVIWLCKKHHAEADWVCRQDLTQSSDM